MDKMGARHVGSACVFALVLLSSSSMVSAQCGANNSECGPVQTGPIQAEPRHSASAQNLPFPELSLPRLLLPVTCSVASMRA